MYIHAYIHRCRNTHGTFSFDALSRWPHCRATSYSPAPVVVSLNTTHNAS